MSCLTKLDSSYNLFNPTPVMSSTDKNMGKPVDTKMTSEYKVASVVAKIKYGGPNFNHGIKLKGGSVVSTQYESARSRADEESVYGDPAEGVDDMLVMFQNVRSWRRRQDEVLQECTRRQLDHVVLLECFRRVEADYFHYRHNSNLFKSRGAGRNSSGIFVGANVPIYKMRNPVGDFVYYKINNVWFMVVYVSKNNTIRNSDHAENPEDHDSDAASDEAQLAAHSVADIERGRQQILRTIRDLFLTQNQVLLMGDWNGLKDAIVPFMEDLRATRLNSGPTYSAARNQAQHYNDLIFYKGLDVELVDQVARGDVTQSDHDALIFRIKNSMMKKGVLKYFTSKLKDEQTLAQWKHSIREFNDPNALGHFFSADRIYASVEFACDVTRSRNLNYIYKKRARYTEEQLSEIRRQNALIYAAAGDERKRLQRSLHRYKYRRRQDNFREYIKNNIREQQHWKLFRAMDRNNTMLARREVKDNILADRRLFVQRWQDELTAIYARKELPPLPPELNELSNIDMDALHATAQDILVEQVDVSNAFAKTKKSKSPGLNQIDYKLLKYAFDADPEYFTEVCSHEINSTESVEDFKKCRSVPIFKNKPGNDRANPRHYRLISIMDCFQKLLESIIIDKFAAQLEELAGNFQHGFIRRRGTHTAVDDYLKFSKLFKERGSKQHVAFIDIEKAYPSVDYDLMVKLCVKHLGNYKYFHKMFGLRTTTAFLDLGFTLVPIPVESGLKEGSKQSCLLFDLVMGEIVRIIDRKHHLGLQHDTSNYLHHSINRIIAYADDLTFMTENRNTLIAIINTLIEYTAYFGLKINVGKCCWLANNFSNQPLDESALQVTDAGRSLNISFTEETLFLGYGIKAHKALTLGSHLTIREETRDKATWFKKLRRLRYVFKGDIAIIRDLFNQFYVARFHYGVNKLMTTLEEFREFYVGLNSVNWKNREEPHYFKQLNKKMATDLGKFAPGNALGFLCAAVFCIKPLHVKHINEITKEDIRDYWLAKSTSRCKVYIVRHWSNIVSCIKHRKLTYNGRRHFLSACYGHVSLSMKYGRYENSYCMCGYQYNTPNALNSVSYEICGHCSLPPVSGDAPTSVDWTPENWDFVNSVRDFTKTRFYEGWSIYDY